MYYLNTSAPYIQFQKAINSEFYVDKSRMIEKISARIMTGNQYICVTRPRRFGKTMNANMLGAYYTKGAKSEKLFSRLAISRNPSYQKHINRHNVIYIDFSRMPDFCGSYREYIQNIVENLKDDLKKAYPELNGTVYRSIGQMLCATDDSFIFILDEWDSIFYRNFTTDEDGDSFLQFLKGLLKDQPYVELAYMTGILPVAKYSSGSELNMFVEFNAMNDVFLEDYFGMSGDEVEALCRKQNKISYEELKYWYDGYYLSNGRSLFNPRSVSCALELGICRNYWTETGPMNEIADCIEHNVDEVRGDIVRMVSGIPAEAELSGYSAAERQLNTRDEILSAMVVYGFLSYHDGKLQIPNHELMEKYQKVLSRDSMGDVKKIVDDSREMLEATLNGNRRRVAEMLEAVHDRGIPFLNYHDENSLSCVITLCYLYARKDFWIKREEKSGKGYCDYLFYPKKGGKPAIILELKADDSAENAIMQIKRKNYLQKAEGCAEILLVGIAYSKKEKTHRCIIEKTTGRDAYFSL